MSDRHERILAYREELAALKARRPRNYKTKARKLLAAILSLESEDRS